MQRDTTTLAHRLGISAPQSPLRMKVRLLAGTTAPEDWLLSIANTRGYRVILPSEPPKAGVNDPGPARFSDEELAVAFLHPGHRDRPQLLRLAAQILSRGRVEVHQVLRLCRMEHSERILAALAHQALRVEAQHPVWMAVSRSLHGAPPLRDVLLHWTRLAEPITTPRLVSAGWRLVS